ncbi:isochorismate synthase [Amycolatopsis sp.]|uniref:isochorismate synthase n=1 Tax=Amycolatopsis sp. TaxID=37632 RepID=UPI002E0AD5BC|nr:isochorismate synthase [Amycolatopsis sp.]
MNSFTGSQVAGAYTRGDFFFANAKHTILGQGVSEALTELDPVRLAESVTKALAGSAVPVAVGVLPFDTSPGTRTPGHLIIPRILHRTGPVLEAMPREVLAAPLSTRSVPSPERHLLAVADAVAALADRRMRKVVLARALDVDFADAVRPEQIVRNLAKDNPRDYTYAAALPDSRTIVGATPELLLARRGLQVISHPHAGTMPRSADPVADRANGEALLRSKKDHIEHAAVTEALVETLRPFCRSLDVPDEPDLVSTPAVWHLGTTITGELIDRDITALRLAAALHPTPAICGTPTDEARALVSELEPFDRGYYAGAVGWVDADGDGEWAVAIRCAEVADTSMRLYAGGGIVPESDPQAELDETSAKFQTLLRAMGLDLPR